MTKVLRNATNDRDKQSLQDDLDKLVKWLEQWQMLFNFGKCKCINIGQGNRNEEYKMGRTITYKEKQLIVHLYKAIVRPHLEYCIQAWRPYRNKDIDKLERIQQRATKMIPELRDLSYESRLIECGLTAPEPNKIVDGYQDISGICSSNLKKAVKPEDTKQH